MSLLQRCARGIVGALRFAHAWRWGALLARVALGGAGLVLLGAIGHSALARSVLGSTAGEPSDAGQGGGRDGGASVGRLATTSVASVPVSPPGPAPEGAVVAATAPPVTESAPPPGQAVARGRATPDDPVYLNQATLAELHRLPGVGPKRAEAILALRTRLGHFRQVEDLLKVKGIGRSSLRKLRPLVRLDAPPAVAGDGGT